MFLCYKCLLKSWNKCKRKSKTFHLEHELFPLIICGKTEFLGGTENMDVRLNKQTRTGYVYLAWQGARVSLGIWYLAVGLHTRSPQRLPKCSAIASHSRNGVSLWHYARLNFHLSRVKKSGLLHACIPLKSTGHLPVTNVNLYLGRAPLVLLKNLTSSIRMLLW